MSYSKKMMWSKCTFILTFFFAKFIIILIFNFCSDLGCHIDGFITVAAHTLVVGASAEKKVTGRKADVILAAYNASQIALRLLKSGKGNYAVTESIQKIAESYKCKPIEGMLSHQLKQFKIDGEKTIIQNPTAAQKKEHEKCEFENYDVYAMDVLVSSGEGTVSILMYFLSKP